jgi:Cys-tRNA(Pro)/Cys-tRNA(Cys) deacylase
MRVLESNGVAYEAFEYDPAVHDATEVAKLLGVPAGQVFKTLVVERANAKPVLIMIPADQHLDLKKFAAAIGEKKINMAAHADAEKLTGLKVGGIGALALMHKHWDVYLDETAELYDWICVSAGQRGVNLRVPVPELIRVLDAKVVDASTVSG